MKRASLASAVVPIILLIIALILYLLGYTSIMGFPIVSALKEVLIYIPVTLGYDIDKGTAVSLLIGSAKRTSNIIQTEGKEPFVLFRDLGNYSITYEINAYTDKPNLLIETKSELINNMLDDFKNAGVEIMSPTHIAIRSSENTVLPKPKP